MSYAVSYSLQERIYTTQYTEKNPGADPLYLSNSSMHAGKTTETLLYFSLVVRSTGLEQASKDSKDPGIFFYCHMENGGIGPGFPSIFFDSYSQQNMRLRHCNGGKGSNAWFSSRQWLRANWRKCTAWRTFPSPAGSNISSTKPQRRRNPPPTPTVRQSPPVTAPTQQQRCAVQFLQNFQSIAFFQIAF